MTEIAGLAFEIGPQGFKIAKGVVEFVLRRDELSQFLRQATGGLDELSDWEFDKLREALTDQQVWEALYAADTDSFDASLASEVRACLRDGPWGDAAAAYLSRRLLEAGLADCDAPLFAKVIDARLARLSGRLDEQRRKVEEALLVSHVRVYDRMDEQQDLLARVLSHLDEILRALPSEQPATVADVLAYLRILVIFLNQDPWHNEIAGGQGLSPTDLERSLQVREQGGRGRLLPADLLADLTTDLVILGQPGSGKTWLAKRIVRRSALRAIDQLTRDAALVDVEIPLYTTCSRFLSTPGDPRQSAVTAAIDALPDAGPMTGQRLKLFFTGRSSHTLLVLDSLDEAADTSGIERARIQGWRSTVTSRPGSWTGQWNTPAAGQPTRGLPVVADLQPLTYPTDVEAFINTWFVGQDETGRRLRAQISDRYRQSATSPLLLTFYCLIAQESKLPRYRRGVFDTVIKLLLRRRWRAGPVPQARLNPALVEVLRNWAWEAVAIDQYTGLAVWNDDFRATLPAHDLPEDDWPRLDSVAVRVGQDDIESDIALRRFVHRTLQEHLVAQRLSALPTDKALDLLIPHLWFDPDWDRVIPTALIDHPRRNELLLALNSRTTSSRYDQSRVAAGSEVQRHLLDVAAESDPSDWTPEAASLIHEARIDQATVQPSLVAASVHWTDSNAQVQAAIRSALRAGDPQRGVELQHALIALQHGDGQREPFGTPLEAVRARMAMPFELLWKLSQGEEDDPKLAEFRDAVINRLGSLRHWDLELRLQDLKMIGMTAEEAAKARSVMLTSLLTPIVPDEDIRDRRALVHCVISLAPTDEERAVLRARLLVVMGAEGHAAQWDLRDQVHILMSLHPTDSEREGVRERIIVGMLTEEERAIDGLAADLDALDRTPSGRANSRIGITDAMGRADPKRLSALVRALNTLGPTPLDRDEARRAVVAALTDAASIAWFREGPPLLYGLVNALIALDPMPEERARARQAVVGALDSAAPRLAGHVDALADATAALTRLEPTPAQRTHARAPLLAAITNAAEFARARPGSLALVDLTTAFKELDPTPEERARARASVLKALSVAEPGAVSGLAMVLKELGLTPHERRSAIRDLSGGLIRADPEAADHLAAALRELELREEERAEVRSAIAAQLANDDPWPLYGHTICLLSMGPSPAQLGQAREAIIPSIPRSPEPDGLVLLLRKCSDPEQWIDWLCNPNA